jgi:hypothetical protein
LWPLEDISMSFLAERFFAHLTHPGFRPSAALFRAIRDMRNLSRRAVLQRCDELLAEMDEDGSADAHPEQYLMLDELTSRIRKSREQKPFRSPQFWGGVVVVGSGWGSPAGGFITPSADPEFQQFFFENVRLVRNAAALLQNGRTAEARAIVTPRLAALEGIHHAEALIISAEAAWAERVAGAEETARRTALRILKLAELESVSEQSDDLINRAQVLRAKLMKGANAYVQAEY